MDQEYVPTDKVYYRPADQGYETTIGKRLAHWETLRQQARGATLPAVKKQEGDRA